MNKLLQWLKKFMKPKPTSLEQQEINWRTDKKGGPKKGKVHPAMRAGDTPDPPHRPYEIIKEGKYIAWLLNL